MNIRLMTSVLFALFLVGCAKQSAVYSVSIAKPERETDLLRSSIHVIEGRVRAIAEELELENVEEDVNVNRGNSTIKLTIENGTDELLELVTERLTTPFRFEFYEQADDSIPLEEAEIVVAERQGFNKIPLETQHINWISVNEQEGTVSVEFTEEGKKVKKDVLSALRGKFIGIFVRGQPVYKFLVEAEDIDRDTLLIKTPNRVLAQVFADDINVGLHVLFTPVQ